MDFVDLKQVFTGSILILIWVFLTNEKVQAKLLELVLKIIEGVNLYLGEAKKQVKPVSKASLAEEGMKVLKSVAEAIASMGKTIEAIAAKLEVEVETPKPEAAPEVESDEVVESEAEAEEEAAEEIVPDLLEAGKCQSLKKDGTQCQMRVPKGAEEPWLCGMHRPAAAAE